MRENKQSVRGSRRVLLKGLGVTLPAVWATPLVSSVVLPVHAQTSGCGAPRGCYATGANSFTWPGGTGPHTVPTFLGVIDCSGESSGEGGPLVVAASAAEAQALLSCGRIPVFREVTDPPAPEGCDFWICGD